METAGTYVLQTFNLLSNLVEKSPRTYYGQETQLDEICFLRNIDLKEKLIQYLWISEKFRLEK